MKVLPGHNYFVNTAVWEVNGYRLKRGDEIKVTDTTSLLTAFINHNYFMQPIEVSFEDLRTHCVKLT